MIDTVTLSIPKGSYKILSPDDFKPSFEPINHLDDSQVSEFMRVYKGGKDYNHLLDRTLRQRGKVYPNLTVFEYYTKEQENYYCDLKITFSCPKLLWGQSFSEVSNKNFTQVINTLAVRLKEIDVPVAPHVLRSATVTRLDYCRNIEFPSMAHARVFLDRLRKCSFPQLEIDLTRYANDGKAVRFHSDHFEVIFYLKYFDLLEPLKRAVDRRRTPQEKAKAKKLEREKKIPSVVRMETRFIGKTSVNSHLYSVLQETRDKWTFKEVFNNTFSQKTRKYYWEKIVSDPRNYVILTQPTEGDVCRKVFEVFNTKKPKLILEGLGLFYILKTVGVPELKDIFLKNYNEDTWFEKRKTIASFALNYLYPNTRLTDLIEKSNG